MSNTADTAPDTSIDEATRRDFLTLSTAAMGAVGVAVAAWPFVDSLNPAADTLALATTEVDLSAIDEGMSITVTWQGKPVFVRHRTAEEIKEAEDVNLSVLVDPQKDSARVIKPEWLIMIGICTHLGCIPLGQRDGDQKGEFNGWFCPCHGSHYDTSGRIRKGPAPINLVVPDYEFLSETQVKIG